MFFSFSYSTRTVSSPSPSSLPPPPPPPPSPNDGLLDINPRKSSFSSAMGMSAACAFPSWPNRPSLFASDSESSVNSYLSDEDLIPSGAMSPRSESAIDEESAASEPVIGAPDLTTEQQIQMIRAAAEDDERQLRYLAQMQAHARAQQALRAAQLAAIERENAKRKKRRASGDRKRRSTSSSSSSKLPSSTTHM